MRFYFASGAGLKSLGMTESTLKQLMLCSGRTLNHIDTAEMWLSLLDRDSGGSAVGSWLSVVLFSALDAVLMTSAAEIAQIRKESSEGHVIEVRLLRRAKELYADWLAPKIAFKDYDLRGNRHYDTLIRIVILGPAAAGKTSMLAQFNHGSPEPFKENPYKETIGVEFMNRMVQAENGSITKEQIWDTAGNPRYASIISAYFRGAHGFIICFDLTSRDSFEEAQAKSWQQIAAALGKKNFPVLLIGCKSDLVDKRVVTRAEGWEAAKKLGDQPGNGYYMECTARDRAKVTKCFLMAITLVYRAEPETFKVNDWAGYDERRAKAKAGAAGNSFQCISM